MLLCSFLFRTVLNRCLYNVQDRKRLNWDVSRVKGDEVAVVQRELKEATRWISLVVHYVIGFFTDSDKAHQVLINLTIS